MVVQKAQWENWETESLYGLGIVYGNYTAVSSLSNVTTEPKILFCFVSATPSSAQGFFLVLHLKISPGDTYKTIWGAGESSPDWLLQRKYLILSILSGLILD